SSPAEVPAFAGTTLGAQTRDPARGQNLRKHLRRLSRSIPQIERHARAALLVEEAADLGIAPGPVADQHGDLAPLESARHVGTLEHRFLVDLAGQAPVGGEID